MLLNNVSPGMSSRNPLLSPLADLPSDWHSLPAAWTTGLAKIHGHSGLLQSALEAPTHDVGTLKAQLWFAHGFGPVL